MFVAIAAVAVVAIAFYAVGREAFTLAGRPKQAVFDVDEAVDFVADRLPFVVAAQLSHDDVRQLIGWHLAFMADKGVPADTGVEASGSGPIVVADEESVAHVSATATRAGMDATYDEVQAVLDEELAYLRAIGAIGPQVRGPADPG